MQEGGKLHMEVLRSCSQLLQNAGRTESASAQFVFPMASKNKAMITRDHKISNFDEVREVLTSYPELSNLLIFLYTIKYF